MMDIEAPLIAKKAKAGQFIILRIDEEGERIPLTIAGYDREKGTIKIIFQLVGKTTFHLGSMEAGDSILDFVGPLGKASELEGYKKACVIGGGIGNLIDRIVHGQVTDFFLIDLGFFKTGIFNMADVSVTMGALMILFLSISNRKLEM